MNILIKNLLRLLSFGVVGYLITLSLIVFNKYIHHTLSHQYSSDSSSFIGTIIFIITNKLTPEDFWVCFYGLLFMLVVGLLRNFERRTRVY